MFQWKKAYELQIPVVDRQHQNLFRLAAELHDDLAGGAGKAVVGEALNRLVEYTLVHFAEEERLMGASGYPGLAAHRKMHEGLSQRVLQLQREFAEGKARVTMEILTFFIEWLQQHILKSDQEYAPYVKARPAA